MCVKVQGLNPAKAKCFQKGVFVKLVGENIDERVDNGVDPKDDVCSNMQA